MPTEAQPNRVSLEWSAAYLHFNFTLVCRNVPLLPKGILVLWDAEVLFYVVFPLRTIKI